MATGKEGLEAIDVVILLGVLPLMRRWLMPEDLLGLFWSSSSGDRAPEISTTEVVFPFVSTFEVVLDPRWRRPFAVRAE